jgi:hypothetical protein
MADKQTQHKSKKRKNFPFFAHFFFVSNEQLFKGGQTRTSLIHRPATDATSME